MKNCVHETQHEEAIKRAAQTVPNDHAIEEVAAMLKCISEPSRLRILLALRQGELCALHVVKAVGGTQSAVSHQLRVLRDNRMIKARRDGQNILYSLADEHVIAVLELCFAHLNCKF